MKRILTALTVAALALGANSAFADAEKSHYGKQKVVYHINYDDPKQQAGAMRNIQNHINAVGKENLDLKVVMHGNGVSLLKRANEDPDFEGRVANLKNQNIQFKVCSNTLKGRKIDYKADLYDVNDSDIVPSGVAEIAHLQAQGYTYLKP